MTPAGWSVELVEQDWKEWIDFFAATFPKPRITLILSPMYDHSTDALVGELAAYAISKYPGRIMSAGGTRPISALNIPTCSARYPFSRAH
jgi:hypothetical protein